MNLLGIIRKRWTEAKFKKKIKHRKCIWDYYMGGGSALLGIPIISAPVHKGRRTAKFKVST